jgi:hypothetical protein
LVSHGGYSIDWRQQLEPMMPFLLGTGGIVSFHANELAPIAAFTRVLRNKFIKLGAGSTAVQLDPLNSNTHYLAEIVSQIALSAGASLETSDQSQFNITIGGDIRARGNVSISEVDINIDHPDTDAALVRALKKGLSDQLDSGRRIAIVFVNSHEWSALELRRLHNMLLMDCLVPLTAAGLLIVDVSDSDKLRTLCDDWMLDANLRLTLPDRFDDDAKAFAVVDLVTIAMDLGIFSSENDAQIFARTLVASSASVRDLHVSVALAVSQLRRGSE